jgi:hypothetical protein
MGLVITQQRLGGTGKQKSLSHNLLSTPLIPHSSRPVIASHSLSRARRRRGNPRIHLSPINPLAPNLGGTESSGSWGTPPNPRQELLLHLFL